MPKEYCLIVSAITLAARDVEELKDVARAMKWNIAGTPHHYHLTHSIPENTTDAEAAHHLHWRASDLRRLKFNVVEERMVWR